MADLKISQFVDGGAVQQTDEIATNRGGVNTKVFVGSAAAYDVGMGMDDIPTNGTIPSTVANTLFGTSDTENTIGIGSLSFMTQALKSFEVGRDLTIVDSADPTTNRMSGIVTAYDSGTGDLTVDISAIYGSGTIDDWIIYVSGTSGENGNDGWSPVLAIISDGTRRVFQVIDWVGGEGIKPDTGDYIGLTGLVADIADGVDVRGPTGPAGDGGHASDIDYDNSLSGLTATNVQGAIDEIVGDLDDYPTTTEMNTAISTVLSPWVAYTPTFTGFGTVTGVNAKSRRVGSNLEVMVTFTTGTPTTTIPEISLGFDGTDGGITIDSGVVGTREICGFGSTASNGTRTESVLATGGESSVETAYQSGTTNSLTPINASSVYAPSTKTSFKFSVPITGWS